MEKKPYEVTETGWGEFEIQIKIFFQDPAEKPVTLFHHLRLYATNETIMGPQNSVISERYEEIVPSALPPPNAGRGRAEGTKCEGLPFSRYAYVRYSTSRPSL